MKTFLSVREVARTGLISEYALRLLLKSENRPPFIRVGAKQLINYPALVDWLNQQSTENKTWGEKSRE